MRDAAIEAAIELGYAAQNLRDSLGHVSAARKKGGRVIRPLKKAGKKAAKAVRRTVSKVTG